MRKFSAIGILCCMALMLSLTFIASAQDDAAIVVSDHLSLNGNVLIDSVTSAGAGWISVHPDMGGVPGPVVGIAPVVAGTTTGVNVPIDLGGATPMLLAMLHVDDGTVGRFEYVISGGTLDLPVMAGDAPMMAPFQITAVRAFPQSGASGMVFAHAITLTGGWLAVSADDNGQPGTALGQVAVMPGTNPNVMIPLTAENTAAVLWVTLHNDDGEVGTFEFDGQSGTDAAMMVNDFIAATPFTVTEAPTVLDEAGVPIPMEEGMTIPSLFVSDQAAMTDATMGTLMVDSVMSAGPGWVDVHADAGMHPGKSLGMIPLPAGESSGTISVMLDAMMDPTSPPFELTPIVWPMLHTDNVTIGEYEFMVVPLADLPVVVDGMVVSLPVNIGGDMGMMESTDEAGMMMATDEAGMMMTDEPGMMATDEAGMMATDEAGMMATPEATDEG